MTAHYDPEPDEDEDPCDWCHAEPGEPCDPECRYYDPEDDGYTTDPETPSIWDEPVPPGW